jgi:hypothetical protein
MNCPVTSENSSGAVEIMDEKRFEVIVSKGPREASHRRSIEKQATRPMKNEDGWMCAIGRGRKNLDSDFLFTADEVFAMFFNVAVRVNHCHWIDREKDRQQN